MQIWNLLPYVRKRVFHKNMIKPVLCLEGGEHNLRISDVHIENSTKLLEHVWFPPPEEPAIDSPVLIPVKQYLNVCVHVPTFLNTITKASINGDLV